MAIAKDKKQVIIKENKINEKDTGKFEITILKTNPHVKVNAPGTRIPQHVAFINYNLS